MIERAEQPTLAIHAKIAGRPDGWRADVTDENCVIRGDLIQYFGDILRVNRYATRLAHGEIVESFSRLLVMIDRGIKMFALRFRMKQRLKRGKRIFHRADQSQIHSFAASDLFATPVNLNGIRLLGIELLVGKIAAEHQQHIAIHHRMIARSKSEQARHADVVGIFIFDELFSAQGMHNGRFQTFGAVSYTHLTLPTIYSV